MKNVVTGIATAALMVGVGAVDSVSAAHASTGDLSIKTLTTLEQHLADPDVDTTHFLADMHRKFPELADGKHDSTLLLLGLGECITGSFGLGQTNSFVDVVVATAHHDICPVGQAS